MPMHPLKSYAPLIVYIDIKSPYAFVALKPTLLLEQKLNMQFDWRPLTLNIPSYLGSATKSKGKVTSSKDRSKSTWNIVKYAYKDARRYAEKQGHILKGTEKIWDSSIANIAILWAAKQNRARLPDYLNAIYPPFWRRELDIENPQAIIQCLQKAEISALGFENYLNSEGRARHDKLQAQFHDVGIYGVPTYVLDGEILFGRENLPYIQWHLSGKKGNPPDIALAPDGGLLQ